ncbi:hypothetical protein JOC36_000153 [Weissella uvarum]|nr:hypothetical protein [Weissella uvarum]MBM7616620.1 hypothetical protein [Weissella uvarum]
MSFFSRISRKIEEVNTGKAAPQELSDELYLNESKAEEIWHDMQPNLVSNVVKAVDDSVERAFIFVDFSGDATIETFFQVDGEIVSWEQLTNSRYVDKIQNQLMVQAQDIADYVNGLFKQEGRSKIKYAELQYEAASGAWFSHTIYEGADGSEISREKILSGWYDLLKTEVPKYALDSDEKLPWFPN